jgi:Fe-S-cluster-containing hydrogenase component 2
MYFQKEAHPMLTSFVIANPQRCLGCFTCMAACSVGHQQQGLQARPRLQITYSPVGTMPVQCHQCEDAPCALVCPVRAIEIEDGLVRLNEVNCIGCKMCVLACPFGAITVDGTASAGGPPGAHPPAGYDESQDGSTHPLLAWLAGQKTVAVKCDLCYSGTEGPACVRFCPTKALQLVSGEQVERTAKLKRIDAVTNAAALLGEQSAVPV